MNVAFSSSFRRAYKKRIKGDKTKEGLFQNKLKEFINNPYHPSLKIHKLSGELERFVEF